MNAVSAKPVFLVVGLRGAGKTTFLASCGISRTSEVAGFIEHDVSEDPRAAKRDTDALVAPLVTATRTRPLAGVLVLVPVGQITGDAHYTALRPVLDAVVGGCDVHVPIHLVVTHLDAVGGHAEYIAATSRHPSVLGLRLPVALRTDPARWSGPITKLAESVLETSIALLHGAAKNSPLRFGIGIRDLAQPLGEWLRRLETPTRGADPLLVRSVFLGSTRDQTSMSLAMQAMLEDGALSRVTSRRLTRATMRWTLPTGIPIFAAALGTSLFLLLRPDPAPAPAAPEPVAEAPAKAKEKLPGFVPDARPIGPKFPPEVCAAAEAASGEWKFQTMVTASNPGQESGIGIRGIYTLVLEAPECNLHLTISKSGHVSPEGAPRNYPKPQIGEDPIEVAFAEGDDEIRILWLPVVLDMNNTDGTDPLKQEFVVGFRVDAGVAKRITGEWRQAGSLRGSTGYWGYLEGGRDSIDPADASTQSCRAQCRLACGWNEKERVDRCRESCATDLFRAVPSCPI